MNRTEKTMKNLYSGLGYEYYTASLLWGMGFEAYKMEADFGFDIMAYNQKNRSFGGDLESTPYLFQVKMRRISKFDEKETGAGIRKSATTEFVFTKDDFERLLREEKSYMICYFVDVTGAKENIIGSFWLNNFQLNLLWKGENPNGGARWKWFKEKDDKIFIKARVQTQANSKETVFQKVDTIGKQLEEVKEMIGDEKISNSIDEILKNKDLLNSWIDRSILVNSNSNVNIYLFADNAVNGESKRILEMEQVEFSNFINKNKKLPIKNYH